MTAFHFYLPFRRCQHASRSNFGRSRKRRIMSLVASLGDIVSENAYDGLLLDQYGVLHNGETVFPMAKVALDSVKKRGAKIVVLSNSSRRSAEAFRKLEGMGLDSSYFVDIVSSGELTHTFLSTLNRLHLGRNVLHINWKQRGAISLEKYDLDIAENCFEFENHLFPITKELSLIVCHGIEAISNPDGSVSEIPYSVLERFVKKLAEDNPNVPFICANPDFVTVTGSVLRTMPGTLANVFQTAGGTDVRRLGKPFKEAYEKAVEILKEHGSNKFLAIGDSLAHDVLGALRHNIDSLYIAGGIDAAHFSLRPEHAFVEGATNWNFSRESLRALIEQNAPELKARLPTYVMPFMR